MVRVMFFGRLGEAAGADEMAVDVPRAGMEVEAFREHLSHSNPVLAKELAKRSVRAVINREMVLPGAVVRDEDEVAFLPPVSGG